MSVVSSLYTGASGLTSHGDALSVVGDNIANANTVGYKSSRANFEDVLANSVGGTGNDIGLGSRLAEVQKILSQGALLGTGVATDLAIKGDGFFAVKGTASGIQGTFYTRAGQFQLDKDGYMVNNGDLKAQGYNVDSSGNLIKSLTDLQVSSDQMQPTATTTAQIDGNLDAGSTAILAATAFDATDPTTYNFSTSMTVYDSLGESHSTTVYYRNDATTGWGWTAMVDGGELTGGTAGTQTQVGTGTLTFGTDGALTAGGTATLAFNTAGGTQFAGAADQTVTLDLSNMTQYAAQSTVSYQSQNGFSSGALSGISIGSDGTVTGTFSNGQNLTVGQVLLADFKAAEDMQRIGSNLFIETKASGSALIGEAASGGRGTITSGALEQSNVDLAQQFVDMIAFQRGFQSSSKTVQTADQMLQTLISLKR